MDGRPERLSATEPALAELQRLHGRHGPLMLFLSGGCCDGSSPLCLTRGELHIGSGDVLLGEIGGVPFYVDSEQYERWHRPPILLDVRPGSGDAFSLEARDDLHFVIRPPV